MTQKPIQASAKKIATIWRVLSLLQTFALLGLMIFAAYTLLTSAIWLDVEGERIPGRYPIAELSDKEYIAFAEQFVNLIASYQYSNARDQLVAASKLLDTSLRRDFQREQLGLGLFTIQDTNRSQIFTVYNQQVSRQADHVIVDLSGTAQKQVGNMLITYDLGYEVDIQVDPNETVNPYGLIVRNYREIEYS